MKDLTWKRLGDIQLGDEIFAFDEEAVKTSRKYRIGRVTYLRKDYQDVYEVELENGDKIKTTANHKWLARSRQGMSFQWIETQQMWVNGTNLYGKSKPGPHTQKSTTVVCKPFNVVHQDKSYESGWLAGMIDADGHICQQNIKNADGTIRYGFRIGIAQSEKYMDICHDIKRLLEKFTNNNKTCRQIMERKDKRGIFKETMQSWQYLVTGTNVEKIQFLQRVRPHKINKVDIEKLGKLKSRYDTKVKAIRYVGEEEIIVMETDTHTFIANGYAMHNCNRFSADHIIGYRENLIKKIGEQRFLLLEVKAHDTKKWSHFELEQLIKYYRARIEMLQKSKGLRV